MSKYIIVLSFVGMQPWIFKVEGTYVDAMNSTESVVGALREHLPNYHDDLIGNKIVGWKDLENADETIHTMAVLGKE